MERMIRVIGMSHTVLLHAVEFGLQELSEPSTRHPPLWAGPASSSECVASCAGPASQGGSPDAAVLLERIPQVAAHAKAAAQQRREAYLNQNHRDPTFAIGGKVTLSPEALTPASDHLPVPPSDKVRAQYQGSLGTCQGHLTVVSTVAYKRGCHLSPKHTMCVQNCLCARVPC
jgi:hypothetical protein